MSDRPASYVNVPERHRTVVALQHEGVGRRFGNVHVADGGGREIDVLLHMSVVEKHPEHLGVGHLFPCAVEAGGLKPDV